MKMVKQAKWAYVLISVAWIALGIAVIIKPALSAVVLSYLLGSVIVMFGIVKLVGYFSRDLFRLAFQFDFALGIFSLMAGVLILAHPMNVMRTVPLIMGLFIITDGVFKMQTAIDARRFGLRGWWSILLLAILSCIGGVLLLIDPFGGSLALMTVLGASMIVEGVQNLCTVAYTVRASRSGKGDTIYVNYREVK